MKFILILLFGLSFEVQSRTLIPELLEYQEKLTESNCTDLTSEITATLKSIEADRLLPIHDLENYQTAIDELWEMKVIVQEKMQGFNLTQNCAHELRNFFIATRMVEDALEEKNFKFKQDSIPFPDNAFFGENPHIKRNPKFAKFDFAKDLESGDVILSRGKAYTSAAISALGDYDTQFSHLSLVYKDPQGKIWTVESHIEVGAFVRPLIEHVEDKNFRTMIFRFKDKKLAAKAAEFIFKKVKKASDTTGNINYDFAFDNENSTELFCSEIASHAFAVASNNEVKIPMFQSGVINRKPKFVTQLGIKVKESFIPADIEVDPRFDMIAEWKNAALITDILEKDAVLQSMYEWSDKFDYVLKQASSFTSLTYRNVAWPLRRVPYLKKYFVNKLPLNMDRKLVGYFGVLESVGTFLQKNLHNQKVEMTASEKRVFLDDLRLDDLHGKRKLHRMFAPSKKKL